MRLVVCIFWCVWVSGYLTETMDCSKPFTRKIFRGIGHLRQSKLPDADENLTRNE